MFHIKSFLAAVVLLFPVFQWAQNGFTTSWSNGFKVESADKNFQLKFGGRIHYDIAYFRLDDTLTARFGQWKSGTEMRRVRFYNQGKIYGNVSYKLQLEFSGGGVGAKDVYVQFSRLPLIGNLRVGQMKEPFRLEVLASSNDLSFMERSHTLPFFPERNTGLLIFNDFGKHIGVEAGLFRNSGEDGNDEAAGEDYNFTARLSGNFLQNEEGTALLHLAVAYSDRSPKNAAYKVSARPSAHLAPKLVSTGTLEGVENLNLVNFELAYIRGPFSLVGEYLVADVETQNSYTLGGYYAQVSYFLTGESLPWKNAHSTFDHLKPKRNTDGNGGWGAWELALRYGAIDLDDGTLNGGRMNEWTVGLNWYLNPAARILLNYGLADVEGVGKLNFVQTRFQVTF